MDRTVEEATASGCWQECKLEEEKEGGGAWGWVYMVQLVVIVF